MDTTGQGHAKPRTAQGRFAIQPGTTDRDARACALRTKGLSYAQIAAQLGFRDKSSARRAVQRALEATVREPAGELRALEIERLDDLTRHLHRVVAARHYAVAPGGKVVRDPDTGEPLADFGPVIAALRELRFVSESRRRLLGLDAPAKHEVTHIDQIDAQLSQLAEQMDRMEP